MSAVCKAEKCVFHGDKLRFDKVTREIQKAGIVPRPDVYRLQMAVCSCKTSKPDVGTLLEDSGISLQTLNDKVKELIHSLNKVSSHVTDYIDLILSRRICLDDHSVCMLLFILYQALVYRNFDLLYNDCTKQKLPVKKPGVAKPKKLTQEQCDMIIRKKMKKMKLHRKGSLPLYPGNLKRLKEDEEFKRLIKAHKANVVLKFNNVENEKCFNNKTPTTHVVYYCYDEKYMKEFQVNLVHYAKTIQGTQDRAHQVRRETRRKYRIITLNSDYEDFIDNAVDNVKESKSTDFDRKHFKDRKSGHSQKKPALASLQDGHCLHCLKPFCGKLTMGENDCKHHPGFIRYSVDNGGYVWTCCGENAEDDKPTHEVHLTSGIYIRSTAEVMYGHEKLRKKEKPVVVEDCTFGGKRKQPAEENKEVFYTRTWLTCIGLTVVALSQEPLVVFFKI